MFCLRVSIRDEVENTLQLLKEHFNVSSETNDLISNTTIEEAGPIFSWLVSCQEIYWITWTKFCHDLFQNYPLKKILMVLFNIKNISIHMQKERHFSKQDLI